MDCVGSSRCNNSRRSKRISSNSLRGRVSSLQVRLRTVEDARSNSRIANQEGREVLTDLQVLQRQSQVSHKQRIRLILRITIIIIIIIRILITRVKRMCSRSGNLHRRVRWTWKRSWIRNRRKTWRTIRCTRISSSRVTSSSFKIQQRIITIIWITTIMLRIWIKDQSGKRTWLSWIIQRVCIIIIRRVSARMCRVQRHMITGGASPIYSRVSFMSSIREFRIRNSRRRQRRRCTRGRNHSLRGRVKRRHTHRIRVTRIHWMILFSILR
jgi:hypothetical protein